MRLHSMLLLSTLCLASIHDGDTFRTCDGATVRLVAASGQLDAQELASTPRCHREACDHAKGMAARGPCASRWRPCPAALRRSGSLSAPPLPRHRKWPRYCRPARARRPCRNSPRLAIYTLPTTKLHWTFKFNLFMRLKLF